MQRKGIIMQLGASHAVVMTHEAEFVKIPVAPGMEIGQEVDVPAQAVQPAGKKSRAWFTKRFKQTGVIAATLLLAAGIWSYQLAMKAPAAYAYVTVDINPSIELAVDNQQKVVAVTPLNSDAESVVADAEVKGMPVQDAVGTLAEIAQTKGYLQNQADVLITATLVGEAKEDAVDLGQLEDDLVLKVKTVATTGGNEVEVEGILVSPEVRDAALEAGVSPGKYAFYLSAQSQGYDVELDDLKQNSIRKVTSERDAKLADVVHDLQVTQLDELLTTFKQAGKSGLQEKAKAVMPAQPKTDPSREEKSTAPGQTKKNDQSNAGAAVQGQQNTSNSGSKKQDEKATDREQNKNNANKNGKDKTQQSSTSDDKESREQNSRSQNDNGKGQYLLPIFQNNNQENWKNNGQGNNKSDDQDQNDKKNGNDKKDQKNNENKKDRGDDKGND